MNQAELKELLHYEPETGVFTWAQTRGNVKKGKWAGCIDVSTGYWVIRANKKLYYAHRLAWFYVYGEWPEEQVDHVNGDKIDNRWVNLRRATNQQNTYNSKGHKDRLSKYKGVSWSPTMYLWEANIRANGKKKRIGYFEFEILAGEAYQAAAAKYHGEFANG